ncbi:MAG: ATP-grasp domain-containing protein, partial [Acidimicrobiales bacterium]
MPRAAPPGIMAQVATILLVLPTGTYRADAYLSAAAHLGVEVIVGSEAAQALAASMGDRFVELPLSDPRSTADAIVAHARRVHLDAVVSVDDEGLVGAALAAERLGLRHSPPAAVAATRDKAEMRRRFAGAGVPQPAFALASPGTPREVERETAELGPPVVVKPATLSGSRGVIRADSAEEAGAAARRIAVILEEAGEPAGSTLVVEKFLPGPEVAVEAICTSGAVSIVAVFDKPDPLDGPYFEETFYVAPSRLGAELLGE